MEKLVSEDPILREKLQAADARKVRFVADVVEKSDAPRKAAEVEEAATAAKKGTADGEDKKVPEGDVEMNQSQQERDTLRSELNIHLEQTQAQYIEPPKLPTQSFPLRRPGLGQWVAPNISRKKGP